MPLTLLRGYPCKQEGQSTLGRSSQVAGLRIWSVVCFIYQSRVSCGRRLSRLRVVMWHVSVYPLPTKAQALGCSVSDSVFCSSAPNVGHQL